MELIGRFYSRRCGWEGGLPIKTFHSCHFFTKNENLEEKSGSEIYLMNDVEDDIKKFAKTFKDWYFYYGTERLITMSSCD